MDCKSLSVCNVVIFYIAIVFSQDATLYLSCDNTCATALNNIVELDFNISSREEFYFRHENVICLDKSRVRGTDGFCDYRLTGCLGLLASSILNRTEGVCTYPLNNTDKGGDFFLDVSRMEEGLYDFACFTNMNFTVNYAIIVNGSNTYKDILIFVNGNVNLTSIVRGNVTITEGNNLAILARAIGDQVKNIKVLSTNATGLQRNVSETRFSCETGVPCNSGDPLGNRYQLCMLRSASAATDNQTLQFSIQYNGPSENIELGEVKIMVNPKPLPTSTTTFITSSPMPTSSSTNTADGTNNNAVVVAVVVTVIIVLVVIIIGLICFVIYYRYTHTDKNNGDAPSPDGGSHMEKMRVLIHTCDDINVEPLVDKLKSNKELDVQELADDTLSLNDDISKLCFEMNQRSVLVDCSCPGGDHSTMQKAVKSFTQKPSGDPNSSKWRIIQLNKCDTNPETSWSKVFGYIDAIDFSDINAIVDDVVGKLIEYSQSRAPSIHSLENEVDTSHKKLLLSRHDGEETSEVSGQSASNKLLLEELKKEFQGVSQKLDGLESQNTEHHKETKELLSEQKEQTQQLITQAEAIGKDTGTLVDNTK